ncbi:bacteriorhodopsin [Tengunoibacter tsumagoiensis]|uniref:Rhodopsin n=1 Tax=Tengunoibacter tsumagoiensis TaxID=2014871 RepID=A0A402AAQ6_9CHLR|nr:bacteriorhodopsin [Tengunoibacter tsumagoiensis]GCE16126.1 rhodopsin [Tengunoibacter tsumagoiensis]
MFSASGPLGIVASTTLWITALIMILGTLAFTFRSFRAATRIKHFYYVAGLVTLIAATLYMLMASGYGSSFQNSHLFVYGRYIDWTFTTPLLLLDLALIALPRNFPNRLAVIATVIGADVYMILTGLVATGIRSDIRWAFFGVSCAGFFAILYFILVKMTPEANMRTYEVQRHYRTLSVTLMALWFCYPIVWALGGEGFGILNFSAEVILYAVLDIAAKVGFGFLVLSNPVALMEAESTEAPISSVASQF